MIAIPSNILLTGGAGFIGSHTYVALVEAGFGVTILDNFENAKRDVPDRLEQITGKPVSVVDCDVRDIEQLRSKLKPMQFDGVVHFAARKSIAEANIDPLGYFRSNCSGLINTVTATRELGTNSFVFSSSAAVYGATDIIPIPETAPISPLNTYSWSKHFGEEMLLQTSAAHPEFKSSILRYFNPVGAHVSGLIGEDPASPPNNLMPVLARVATGELSHLDIFGDDYDTPDGTGVRDYIHVSDLATGHVKAIGTLLSQGKSHLVNLGTGKGYSVKEMIDAYASASGRDLPYHIVDRRPGDAAMSYANVELAKRKISFEAQHDLKSMCESSWEFVSKAQK